MIRLRTRTERMAILSAATVAVMGATLAVANGTAVAAPPNVAGVQAVQVGKLSLRLASDPGQLANVSGAATTNGAPVIQWPWTGQDNERWEAESTLDGYYRFKAINSGKCLNVSGGGSVDGTPVIQYTCGANPNELWKLVPAGIGYQVVSKGSGKCLNVKGGAGKGNPLIQYTCVAGGAPNDVWLPVWEQ